MVQYVLDLNDPRFSDAVIRQFIGNVCLLSVQKFSSNVIEKVSLVRWYLVERTSLMPFSNSVHPRIGNVDSETPH